VNRAEFDTFVQRVERGYAGRPLALRLKLARLTVLSFAVFAAWLLLATIPGALVMALGFFDTHRNGPHWVFIAFGAVVTAAMCFTVGRALWVRVGAPEGTPVTRSDAPALFALLDEVRAALRSSRFHRVLVDGRCNAMVVQQPLLGVFGWQRNHLVLGLPLLDVLSPGDLRAVLAHEFAHLSAQHGRFGAWIYRTRRSWERVFEEFNKPGRTRGGISLRPVLAKFVGWFWPRFNAHAFVLSRENECHADSGAARIAGVEHVASSLLRTACFGRLLDEKLWEDVKLTANSEPEPPADVFTRLRDGLRAWAGDSAKWVEEAFRTRTTNADTHPSLSDRLRALGFLPADVGRGVFPPAPALPAVSATAALLGDFAERIRSSLSARWQKDCTPAWREAHARAGLLRHRLAGIESAQGAEDAERLWEKADVIIRLHNDAAAAPLLREVLAMNPDHAAANFCLGRHLLSLGDETGEPHILRAMESREDLVQSGCELLLNLHRRLGREDRMREVTARLDAHDAAVSASHRERSSVSASDTFMPHDLSAAELAPVAAALGAEREVRAVHIARKRLKHFPKQRLFVVVLITRWRWFGGEDLDHALAARLLPLLKLPGRMLLITPRAPWRAVAAKVRRVVGSETYRRIA
jgi:Zn-dependent protease with chaperone function